MAQWQWLFFKAPRVNHARSFYNDVIPIAFMFVTFVKRK